MGLQRPLFLRKEGVFGYNCGNIFHGIEPDHRKQEADLGNRNHSGLVGKATVEAGLHRLLGSTP